MPMTSGTQTLSAGASAEDRRPTRRIEHRLAAGSLASFVALALGIATAFVQVPILLMFWGDETYGAWLLVIATYSLVISLDIGHQNFFGNRISMIGMQDTAACRIALGAAVRAAWLIGLIEIAIAFTIVWTGVFSIWLTAPQTTTSALRSTAELCLLLHTAYFALLGSIGGIIVRLYYAGGMYARAQWAGIAQRLAMFLALVIAVSCGASMLNATIAHLGAGAAASAWVFNDVRRRFPEYWPWWRSGSLTGGMHQAALSLGLTATCVSDQLATAGLLGITGARAHSSAVATLGTLRTLTNSILQASSIFVLPISPDLSRYAAGAERQKATAAISVLWLISTAPLCVGVTILAPFAEPVYEWWTRGRLSFPSVLFLMLAIGVLIRQWQSPMAMLLFSANRLRPQGMASAMRTIWLLGALVIGYSITNDIAVAGLAVLISELAGAVAILVSTRSFIAEMQGTMPAMIAGLAASQVAITAANGACYLAAPASPLLIVGVSFVLHIVFAFAQWRALPGDVHERVVALWRR